MAKKTKKPLSRRQVRRRRRRRILIFEIVLLLLLCGGLFVWSKFGMLTFDDIKDIAVNDMDDKTKDLLKGYTNIAFFGVDNRDTGDYETGHSDSIMVCSINNDTKQVKIVSIYRDTLLQVKDSTLLKATEAYQYGGHQGAIQMLNTNLDMDIEEYVAVDFRAVAAAVDAVGGIELDITDQEASIMNKNYITEVAEAAGKDAISRMVQGGKQKCDGVQATAWCRVRYTEGNDYKRAERQRTVVKKLVEKAKKASLSELSEMVDAVLPYVQTSLSAGQILSLGKAYKDYELVGNRGFPFRRTDGTYGKKGSIVVPCTLETNVQALYGYLFGEPDHVCSSTVSYISNEIQNFTGKGPTDGVVDDFVEGEGADQLQDETTDTTDTMGTGTDTGTGTGTGY